MAGATPGKEGEDNKDMAGGALTLSFERRHETPANSSQRMNAPSSMITIIVAVSAAFTRCKPCGTVGMLHMKAGDLRAFLPCSINATYRLWGRISAVSFYA
jgi:hypothetical protein